MKTESRGNQLSRILHNILISLIDRLSLVYSLHKQKLSTNKATLRDLLSRWSFMGSCFTSIHRGGAFWRFWSFQGGACSTVRCWWVQNPRNFHILKTCPCTTEEFLQWRDHWQSPVLPQHLCTEKTFNRFLNEKVYLKSRWGCCWFGFFLKKQLPICLICSGNEENKQLKEPSHFPQISLDYSFFFYYSKKLFLSLLHLWNKSGKSNKAILQLQIVMTPYPTNSY